MHEIRKKPGIHPFSVALTLNWYRHLCGYADSTDKHTKQWRKGIQIDSSTWYVTLNQNDITKILRPPTFERFKSIFTVATHNIATGKYIENITHTPATYDKLPILISDVLAITEMFTALINNIEDPAKHHQELTNLAGDTALMYKQVRRRSSLRAWRESIQDSPTLRILLNTSLPTQIERDIVKLHDNEVFRDWHHAHNRLDLWQYVPAASAALRKHFKISGAKAGLLNNHTANYASASTTRFESGASNSLTGVYANLGYLETEKVTPSTIYADLERIAINAMPESDYRWRCHAHPDQLPNPKEFSEILDEFGIE